MPRKPIVIENSAGDWYGNSAEPFGLPSVASHTAGDTTVSSTDETRPRKPPITAPRVVQSFHSTDISSTGKLADAAIANARDDHEGDVLLLERDAERDRDDAEHDAW